MTKETTKHLARKLREQGKSYSEIKKIVDVSKSTISLWLRDIPLSKNQKESLHGRAKSRYAGAKAKQEKRIQSTKEIIKNAKKETISLLKNKLFIPGIMLYWAEGAKRSNDMVIFSNSDPNMIKLMMQWFREICEVKNDKFKIQLQIHSLLDEKQIKKYWSEITEVSIEQFHKTIIKPTSLQHRKNILYNGTCCIRIYDRQLFRKMIGWKIGILKYFNLKDNYIIPK
jgi:hypothetical protein